MKLILIVCALTLVLAPGLATAGDPKTPEEFFKLAEDEYNLGNFEKAVDAFKKGFALETNNKKKSAYIYGIAQAYRQAKNCVQAEFFYKRFLALRGPDIEEQMRKDVEDRIKELDECAKKQSEIAGKPPDSGIPPEGTDPNGKKPDRVATKDPNGEEPDPDPGIVDKNAGVPRLISVRATGGGAKLATGTDLEVPIQATVAVLGGYPLALNEQITLDLGGGFTFTPVPFDNMDGDSKSAQLIGLIANVGATYHVMPKIGVRGDLGLGVLMFTGASESPFTAFAPTSGALTMLHVRIGASADFAITPNFIATVTPLAFSYSPAKAGLETVDGDKIKSITAIDFMVGLGYRM